MRTGLLAVLLGTFCVATVIGQESPAPAEPPLSVDAPPEPPPTPRPPRTPTPVPTPADGITLLQPFEGRWICEGVVPETLLSRAHKTRATLTIRRELDGFWWAGRYVQEKTEDNPRPLSKLVFWSWDTT